MTQGQDDMRTLAEVADEFCRTVDRCHLWMSSALNRVKTAQAKRIAAALRMALKTERDKWDIEDELRRERTVSSGLRDEMQRMTDAMLEEESLLG